MFKQGKRGVQTAGTGSSPMMQPIPRPLPSSPCGCQDQAWVPLTFHPLSWDLLVTSQRRGNVCPFPPSAQPMLSSNRLV